MAGKKKLTLAQLAKVSVERVLETLSDLLEGNGWSDEDLFEDQIGALCALEDSDEIEDEDDIAEAVGDLDVSEQIKTLETKIKDLKQYQAIVKANRQRIINHVANQMQECPRCQCRFRGDA